MKKISVNLDDIGEAALTALQSRTKQSVSDLVNIALVTLQHTDYNGVGDIMGSSLLYALQEAVEASQWRTIDNWCRHRNIKKERLTYLIDRCYNGHTVYGSGSKNRWRDKEDGRIFKTHTSWIAHCLKEDFDIDLIKGDL